MSISRIKKDDTVIAVSGASVGKTGKVLQVAAGKGVALVEGLNLVKKTMRKSQDNPQGGIVEKETPVKLCNLMPYCSNCKKGVRIRRDRQGSDAARKCALCGHTF